MRTKDKFLQHFRLPAKISVYPEIVEDVQHLFFMLEGNSNAGSPLTQRNPACRAGVALVRTARLLRAGLRDTDVQGANYRSFVFSATMSPGSIELCVHWAEGLAEKEAEGESGMVVYHMTKLSSKALDNDQRSGQLSVAHEQRQQAESAAKGPEQETGP
ncbi:MAG: hypothetical protein Q9208_007927 [Pyrenodesmia sp. 3 TL-2023]